MGQALRQGGREAALAANPRLLPTLWQMLWAGETVDGREKLEADRQCNAVKRSVIADLSRQ